MRFANVSKFHPFPITGFGSVFTFLGGVLHITPLRVSGPLVSSPGLTKTQPRHTVRSQTWTILFFQTQDVRENTSPCNWADLSLRLFVNTTISSASRCCSFRYIRGFKSFVSTASRSIKHQLGQNNLSGRSWSICCTKSRNSCKRFFSQNTFLQVFLRDFLHTSHSPLQAQKPFFKIPTGVLFWQHQGFPFFWSFHNCSQFFCSFPVKFALLLRKWTSFRWSLSYREQLHFICIHPKANVKQTIGDWEHIEPCEECPQDLILILLSYYLVNSWL